MGKKKSRDKKVSKGEHGGGGKVKLTERQRPASLTGGLVAKFKPVGTVDHSKGIR